MIRSIVDRLRRFFILKPVQAPSQRITLEDLERGYAMISEDNPYREIAKLMLDDVREFEKRKKDPQ